LTLRRQYHDTFTTACGALADGMDEGRYGTGLEPSAHALRAVSKLTARQDRQALAQAVKVIRGFRHLPRNELSPAVMRLLRETRGIAEGDEATYGEDFTAFFQMILKLSVIPTQMKTLLRKVIQLGKGSSKSLSLTPHEDENPGAWFDMTEEEKAGVRKTLADIHAQFEAAGTSGKSPEEKRAMCENASRALRKVLRETGVNRGILESQKGEREPLEDVLKREAKMDVDGGTQFVVEAAIKSFISSAKHQQSLRLSPGKRDNWKEDKAPLPRDAGKFVTLLRKAKTLETVQRIIGEASDKGIVSRALNEDLKPVFDSLQKNKAIKEGVPLVPLYFKPMKTEEFRAAHDTGAVELPDGMPPEESEVLLGRVSRAITDLEGIFGKGFCGKHKKKLAFRFGGKSNVMAKAHYFAWDDKREWQPRVTFGDEYEGVLAHELSHYFEDLIAFKLDTRMNEEKGETSKYPFSGGPGDIFGRASAEYFAESYVEGTYNKRQDALHTMLPEAFDLMAAVTNTPDYARWEDKLTNAHADSMAQAVKNLTGMSVYDLPTDHPYYDAKDAGWTDAQRYKSQFPPELVKEAERVYRENAGGDDRKLFYYQSAAEVWARMCEQYVYTKLSKAGIVNPWLTWLTYEQDVYIDDARFERDIAPIFDRLFAKLGTRNIMASLLARFRASGGRSRGGSCS
jgi:hypothetical protein